MMLVCCLIVVLRYGFAMGSTAIQELLGYLHGTAFMLGAAYTLHCDEHVRVDILYRRFNNTQKAWVDATGTLFLLLPVSLFLLWFGWQFFHTAWLLREGSAEPGGLAYVYLLKAVIPLASGLLLLQTLALFIQNAGQLIIRKEP